MLSFISDGLLMVSLHSNRTLTRQKFVPGSGVDKSDHAFWFEGIWDILEEFELEKQLDIFRWKLMGHCSKNIEDNGAEGI